MADQHQDDIKAFIKNLPDPEAASIFLYRLQGLTDSPAVDYERNPLFLCRLLTLAAYSPFLAETMLRHSENIGWLQRETQGDLARGKSTERLSEDLARFVSRITEADQPTRLVRFKRRELLRIYLRDCVGVATLSEVTEELSNL